MKNEQGFTLVELMIVAAIVGILVAIGLPSYQNHVAESKRTEGIGKLMEIMQQQESFYSENYSYTADLENDLGYSAATLESENGYYTVSAAACGDGIAACVNLTATPATASDGVLTLDSAGARTGPWPD